MKTHHNCHSRESGNLYNKNCLWIPYQVRDDKVTSRLAALARRIITIVLSLITYHLSLISTVFAQSPSPGVDISQKFGFGSITSLGQATSKLVMPIFSVITAMVILYFLWGAFNYLQSRGDKEEVEQAQQMIIHAIIGFIILMLAFMVLQFLLSSLFGVTGFQIFQT